MRDPARHRQGLFGLLSPGGPLGSSDEHGHSLSWTLLLLCCSGTPCLLQARVDLRENSDTTFIPPWANSSAEQTLIYLTAASCSALPEPTPSCLQQLWRRKTPAPSTGRCQPQPVGSPSTPSAPLAPAAQP